MWREKKELESRQLAFFSAVSHELKTPITILKGQLQGMLYHVGGYIDRDKYLKRSFEITCSMEQLVMEILTVTRMKASGFTAQIETFDLPALISGILEDFADLFSEKKHGYHHGNGTPKDDFSRQAAVCKSDRQSAQ